MPQRSSIPGARTLEELLQGLVDGSIDANLSVNGKNPVAVALGRKGGLKGGKARAEALTAKRRSEISRLAARARWKKAR